METPLVSIIIPVYGIEKYIGQCVESIMEQSYRTLQIILVDDGSPDRCPDICDLYASKDARIEVIHKPNGGLVSARKAGLQAAQGDYVCYVDGDDWVEPAYVENLVDAVVGADVDMAASGYHKDILEQTHTVVDLVPPGVYEGRRLVWLQERMMSIGGIFEAGLSTYLWNKIYRRELLLEPQMAVDERISIGEDTAVVYPAAMLARKIVVTDSCFYHYRQRDDSMLKGNYSTEGNKEKIRVLYEYMCAFSLKYDALCGWKRQVDDFVLGVCMMHIGGPMIFGADIRGKKVAIFKAGVFGQHLHQGLRQGNVCEVVSWVDDAWKECRRCGLDVDPVESISTVDFDYVLLASMERPLTEEATRQMESLGIPEEKILSINETGDHHSQVLHYLYD